jgi:hypothetical protein
MTYFPDLAPYDYLPLPKGVTALTVGWLDDVHTFPTGDLSAEFLARLFRLCADRTIWLSLGWHVCELCYREGMFERLASTLERDEVAWRPTEFRVGDETIAWRFWDAGGITIRMGNEIVELGGAQLCVEGRDGAWLIAPDLILHYVVTHRYLPPEVFIEGVMASRILKPD